MSPHYSYIQIQKTLRSIGFSDNEISVLNFLFRKKRGPISFISRHTTLSQNSTRFSLENLKFRSLVSLVSSSDELDPVYEICDESEFLDWIDLQQEKYSQLYRKAEHDFQEFFSILQESAWKPGVLYYEGHDGMKEIYEDILHTGETIYAWTNLSHSYFSLDDYMKEFVSRRVEKGIRIMAIRSVHGPEIPEEMQDESFLRDVAVTTANPLNGEVRIYGDKVAVMTFDDKEPVGFVFQGQLITGVFKRLFQDYWRLIKDK